jgi:hypothetical protein
MKLVITHPELAPRLVSALTDADCVATLVASDTIEVRLDGASRSQAATELMFFVKAWAASHPAFRATLVDAG